MNYINEFTFGKNENSILSKKTKITVRLFINQRFMRKIYWMDADE